MNIHSGIIQIQSLKYNLELLAKIKSGIKRMQPKTYFCLNENEMRKRKQEHI